MGYSIRTVLLRGIPLALLLLSSGGGCAVVHDLGYRPKDPAHVIPHHKYMPRGAQVCPLDAGVYGYHATCWNPWPQEWESCPPPHGGTDEITPDFMGDPIADVPTLAPDKPASELPVPPKPRRVNDLKPVPAPQESPTERAKEPRSAPEGKSTSLPSRGELEAPSALRSIDNPFRDERSPAMENRVRSAARVRIATPPDDCEVLVESFGEGPAQEASASTWLVSAVEDPDEPPQSDWLLYVEDEGEDSGESTGRPVTQASHSAPDKEPGKPGALESLRASLTSPKSLLSTFR